MNELEDLQNKMYQIKTWINAYPLEVFPEPNFKKAAKILKQHGMTLDSISASNMRYVLNGIKDIINTSSKSGFHNANYYKRKLFNLLAIIHRDGGHYTEDHGVEQSVKDAVKIVTDKIVI